VVVEFPNENRSFRIQGKVISRRRSFSETPLPPGVEVEFFLSEKRTVQLCLDHVSGKNIDFTDRDSRRVPCSLAVFLKWNSDRIREIAEDISEGGIYVRTEKVQPVGTKVDCRLKPPGYLIGIGLLGKVAWLQDVGLSRGMGISFAFKSQRQRKKISELVKKLAQDQNIQVKRKIEKLRHQATPNPFSKR
jgi:type IV pilus assembly protein PilZ